MRQLSFLPRPSLEHGGSTRVGKRKVARPIDPKRPVHLVLRSSRAQGAWSMLQKTNKARILQNLDRLAEKHSIRVYRFSNVGNHLHLLVSMRRRKDFQNFLRELAGSIAMLVTGAAKGSAAGKFWDVLAYTRIVSWGREFKILENYLIQNLLESFGVMDRKREKLVLRDLPS